ncbi:MAG: GPP34 family phosphoprotein [Micromonosporaceae bacterium]
MSSVEAPFDGRGRRAVADQLFVLAHDEHTGRPRLQLKVLGLGLAAGLLAELAIDDHIDVMQGRVIPTSRSGIPADPLTRWVHARLQAESNTLSDWLAFLAQSARDRVGRRLVEAGQVREVQERRLLRPVVSFPAADPNVSLWWAWRLRSLLTGARQITEADLGDPNLITDVMVLALLIATELAGHLFAWDSQAARPALIRLVTVLPYSRRSLALHVHQAVGQATLARRS